MKKTFTVKNIDIDGTEFYTIISKRVENTNYFPILKDDIESIFESKEVNLENIQELFTFLVYSDENYKHYYEGLKTLIQDDMCPQCAIEFIDNNIGEDRLMFSFLEEYFEYEFTIDGIVKIDWREI